MKAIKVMAILVGMFIGIVLPGCTSAQAAKLNQIENNVKTGVKIADEALVSVDAIVNVAAPGSTAAKNLNNATVTAQKVNGVVQTVTIAIPVDPVVAPAPAVTPAGN